MLLKANDEVDHIIYDNFKLGYWVRAFVLKRVWFYDVPNVRMLCYSQTDYALPRSVRELPPFICLRPRVSAHECFNLFMQPEFRIEVSRDVEKCTVRVGCSDLDQVIKISFCT